MLQIRHISKSFQQQPVLNDINAELREGQVNMVIGKSGGGKTVLMKIMLGLITPDMGDVWYNDTPFFQLNEKEKKNLRSSMGMVFQGAALFDSISVRDNIMMPLNFHTRLSEYDKNAKIKKTLDRVNLVPDVLKKFPNELSGGMKKRVAIARAIILDPKYFFCDEPNSGLDPHTSIVIDNLILSLTQDHKMITVINTHDMQSVLNFADHILFIKDKRIAWAGNRHDLVQEGNAEVHQFVFAHRDIHHSS